MSPRSTAPMTRRCLCGWVLRGQVGTAWPECCGLCNGQGAFSTYRLGKVLSESPRTLRRVDRGSCKQATAVRVFEKVTRLLEAWGLA